MSAFFLMQMPLFSSTVFSGGFGMGVCWRRGLMDSIFNGAYPTLTHVPCGPCTVPS